MVEGLGFRGGKPEWLDAEGAWRGLRVRGTKAFLSRFV